MRFDLRFFIAVPILMISAVCTPTKEKLVDDEATKEADVQKIHDLREEFLVLNRAKDAAGIANLHAHDIVQMIPNSESVVGRDALQAWLQRSYDGPDETGVEFSTEEVEILGDWAFVRGKYVQTGPADSGKFLQILKRQPDGSWKWARNTWSSDHPASCD